MEEVQGRCVLLQNLAPNCTVANITEVLDHDHGDFRFTDKYEKIHKLMDNVRWIVLFHTKKDADECIQSGEWECSILGETYVVKPECCPLNIIPDEYLQNTSNENDNLDKLAEDSSNDLKDRKLHEEHELKFFIVEKTDQAEDATAEANFNLQRVVGNPSLDELFGSEKGKKDMSTQFSDSIRSADLFGSGFESTNFSNNKANSNSDTEEDILKRRHARILADSVENPDLFCSDKGYIKMSKPLMVSAENQHNITFIGSDNTANSCSSRYSDALPIKGAHAMTSSSESSGASQRHTLNDVLFKVPAPQNYPQFRMVGDFGDAGHRGVYPSMLQNIPSYFIPNENYRFPYPPFHTMQHMQQFPGFYPMPYPTVSSGLQYHGLMPPWVYVPIASGNNDNQRNTHGPVYDIPKERGTDIKNENESEIHVYDEIEDIEDTSKDDDDAHSRRGAESNLTEEPTKAEKLLADTRNSGRPLPLLPGSDRSSGSRTSNSPTGSRTSDSSTGSRTSDKSTGSRKSDSSTGSRTSDSSTGSRKSDSSTGSRTSDSSNGSRTFDNLTDATKRDFNESNPLLRNSSESDRKEVDEDKEEIGQRMKGGNKKILVRGLSVVITKEDLESYFETRRIGGGEIESSEIDEKKRQAIIEFKSEIDAREVVKRASKEQTYILNGCNLEVLEFVPPTMDPMKVFIQGIADDTTDEGIISFVKEICQLPCKVILGETPGTAMLCFDVAPDLQQLQTTCETRKIDGCYWQITPVEETRSVQVSFLNSEISNDSLSSHFENERISDGGPVKSVVSRADRKDCIVTFMHAEDAERTHRNGKHVVDGQTIEVKLYYPCLELDDEHIVKIPDPLVFDEIDEHICKFLQNSPKYRSMIENGVSSQHGLVVWDAKTDESDTCIQIVCTVDPRDRHGKKKVKYWTENCRLEVTDVVDTLAVKRSQNIAVEEWSNVKSLVGKISVPDPQNVEIVFADNECVVIVAGEKQHVIKVYQQIQIILDEVGDQLKAKNPVITKKLRFEMYEMKLFMETKLEEKFRKSLEEFSFDKERSELTFKGKQKDVDHALTKLRSKLQSFVSTRVPGFTSEAKRLLMKSRVYITNKMKQEKIVCVWRVQRKSDVILYGTDEKHVERAAQILQNLIKEDSIQLDQSNAHFVHSEKGKAKLRFLMENDAKSFSCSLLQYELRFACFAQIYDEIKSAITDLLDSHNVVSHFIPTDIGKYSFIIQYKRAELNHIEKRYKVGLEPVGIEPNQGFNIKGKNDGCRLRMAIIELQKINDSVVHKDLKLDWPGLEKYLKSKEGLDEMKQIELNEKCVLKVLFEESTLPEEGQTQNKNPEDGSGPTKHQESDMRLSEINKKVVLGTLAAEKADVIVNSTNFNLDMKVGGISRSLLKAGGDQLAKECNTKYPDGIKLGEIAVTSGGSLNCKHLFHGVLIKWDGGQGHAERVMTHFIKACLEHAHTYKFESISFPALGTGNLAFPAEVVAQIMNDVVDEFELDNPNTSLKLVNFVIRNEDWETAKAFEGYTAERRIIRRTREDSRKSRKSMVAEKIIMQGSNLHTTIDDVSIIVEQGDITKTPVGAIVNSTVDDLNLNSGAISRAILRAAGSSIQKEAFSHKEVFNSKGLVVTRQGRLTMCQKIVHIRARNGQKGWTESIQQCLAEIESLGLKSVAFPALGTGGKGVPAEQMAKTMIEAFQEFIKSPKYKGCLGTIHIVIFDSKMLDTFVAVIKNALNTQPKKRFFQFFDRKSDGDMSHYTTVHIYAGCSQYIESAISKLEAIRRDKDVAICASLRINCNDCYVKDLQKIGHKHGVLVRVGREDVKVIGYGKAADAAVTDVEKYLRDLETRIEKDME